MKRLKVTGNNTCQRIYVRGDKHAEAEPEEFYIHFPGGTIGYARCSDNTYWAHLCLEDNKKDFSDREFKSHVIDARVDCKELHAGEMNTGDMSRSDCYHIAVKVKITA